MSRWELFFKKRQQKELQEENAADRGALELRVG